MKNKMKKGLIYIMFSVFILSYIPSYAFANSNMIIFAENDIKIYTEQIATYYKMVNGREQMRVWSRTYGHWITEWTWV